MKRNVVRFVSLVTQPLKTIGRGPDVTEICVNTPLSPITLIVCKIRTERSRAECLQYEPIRSSCNNTENQTVFLHLNLTAEDNGNHTCECSHPEGTDILHLNITVEEDREESISTQMQIPGILIGAAVFIIITAVTLVCLQEKTSRCLFKVSPIWIICPSNSQTVISTRVSLIQPAERLMQAANSMLTCNHKSRYTRFLTGMEAKWRLFLVLLLPLTKCKVTIVKTIGRAPDITEICVNTPLSPITMIVCKIRTERSGAECRLHYEPIEVFEQPCDSRFSLKTENQTVFLHLMNLTAVDSGNHTCECSYPEGTDILHLNITVEEDREESISTRMQIPVTIEKTIGRGPDVTEICVNNQLSNILFIVCKIRTERNAECNLLYEPIKGFEQQCDSRFSLKTENQTVFLHLMNLTAEDSGNHTCHCCHIGGTYEIHLNITVEDVLEDVDGSIFTQIPIPGILIGAAVFIITTAVTLWCFFSRRHQGVCSRSVPSGSSACENPGNLPSNSQTVISTRVSLIQPAERRVLWRTRRDTAETDASCKLYANIDYSENHRERTRQRSGAECLLLFEPIEVFEQPCDSRFSLKTENQTVFLHLMNLTAVDSGNHTCECSYPEGTDILHLNITVEEDREESISTQMQIPGILIGAAVFIIITAVTIWCVCRRRHQGVCSRSAPSGSSACENPGNLPDSDLYQSVSNSAGRETGALENQKRHGRETDASLTIVKTIGRGPDVTEICVNTPLSPITMIVCKIRTERSGAECFLLFEPIEVFEQPCDSRFSLKTENQTVFLHLMNLTAEDKRKAFQHNADPRYFDWCSCIHHHNCSYHLVCLQKKTSRCLFKVSHIWIICIPQQPDSDLYQSVSNSAGRETGYTRFLTGMEAKWRLFLVLLLPLTKCEVTIVKTIGRGPDVTEICVNTPLSPITLIVCKIRTERSGAECNLQYEPIKGFVQPCDSRFSLKTENQTVFLHLVNLTAEDSGNHTCECSHPEGTDILHLNITVEEDREESISTQMQIPGILIGAAVFIIITAVILGSSTEKHVREDNHIPQTRNEEDIEPYSTFMQRESGLYSTVRINMNNPNSSHVSSTEETLSGSL
ncbi:hypothetical protein F7725_008948 [Dissostichus mawsoni]|uniref:Uncharacterized protein n=1 Tax=Dissostichus mawsoni TaxID=36200 RepID=A0A7J5Z7L5_DISMA|nr:hypothetical protein F7725_008948 [Dissostichus mawsoni]